MNDNRESVGNPKNTRRNFSSLAWALLRRSPVMVLMIVLFAFELHCAHAVGFPTDKVWSTGSAITGTLTVSSVVVEPGQAITLSITGAGDTDAWIKYNPNGTLNDSGTASDTITYSWDVEKDIGGGTGTGTLSAPTSSSTSWTAPDQSGLFWLSCVIDDTPTSVVSPETGSRDDEHRGVAMRIGVIVKYWTTELPVGQSKDGAGTITYNGRITSPQDQRSTPASPAKVLVDPGEAVSVAVETATDRDMWVIDRNGDGDFDDSNEKAYEADSIASYTWTCSGGGFVDGASLVSSKTGQSVTWKAPLSGGGRYTLTCTIKDTPTSIPFPEVGSRDDSDLVRTVTIDTWKASLKVRRTSADSWSGSTTLAAGNVTNAAHQADIEATLTDYDDQPVVGKTPNSAVVVSNGKGIAGSGVIASITSFGATDSSGKTTAKYQSGLRVEETVGIKLPYDAANPTTSAGPTASVAQTWGDSYWQYDLSFEYDVPSEVSITLELPDATGIAGHDVSFVNTGIAGWEWDDTAGDDWDDDGIADGDYFEAEYTPEDVDLTGWDAWNSLSSFGTVTDSDGTYSADQTIAYDDDFIVDYVEFDMNDGNVYDPDGYDFSSGE